MLVRTEGGPCRGGGGHVLVPESEMFCDSVVYFPVVRESALVGYTEALQSEEVDVLLQGGPDDSSYFPLEAHLFEVGHVRVDGEAEVVSEPLVEHALDRFDEWGAEQWMVDLLELCCPPCTRPKPGLVHDSVRVHGVVPLEGGDRGLP